MPFMVIDGHKMKIDNNTFDTMSQLVQDELQTSSEEQPTNPDGETMEHMIPNL